MTASCTYSMIPNVVLLECSRLHDSVKEELLCAAELSAAILSKGTLCNCSRDDCDQI